MSHRLWSAAASLLSLPAAALAQPAPPAPIAQPAPPVQIAPPAPPVQIAPPAPPVQIAPPAPAVEGPAPEPRPEPTIAAPPPAQPAIAPGRHGRHSVEVAYFGQNFIRPGMQLGYSLRTLQTPGRRHALVVGVDVGAYAWLRHDFGVFVLPRLGWRGRHRVGLQGEVNFHLGYLQSVLASPAYKVESGQVVEASREGIANLLLGTTLGVGWFVPRLGLTPFARVGALWHTPVFDQTLLRFVLQVGAEVRL